MEIHHINLSMLQWGRRSMQYNEEREGKKY